MIKISASDRAIWKLSKQEFLTNKQIAQRRQISERHVRRVLKKIRENEKMSAPHVRTPIGGVGADIFRVHGQRWSVSVLGRSEHFERMVGRRVAVRGATVEFRKNHVILYGNGYGFTGGTVSDALQSSYDYWDGVAAIIENDYGVLLRKERRANWKCYGLHVAHLDDELAVECNKKRQRIQIRGRDGKVWLLTDNSFSMAELETVDGESAADDMQGVVMPFVNDLRENKPMLPSELQKVLGDTVTLLHETATALTVQVKLNTPSEPKQGEGSSERPSYVG